MYANQHTATGDEVWADTELTTHLWRLISSGDVEGLRTLVYRDPTVVHMRPKDGRGALWWAYEYNQPAIIKLLTDYLADEEAEDKDGKTAKQMAPGAPKAGGKRGQ